MSIRPSLPKNRPMTKRESDKKKGLGKKKSESKSNPHTIKKNGPELKKTKGRKDHRRGKKVPRQWQAKIRTCGGPRLKGPSGNCYRKNERNWKVGAGKQKKGTIRNWGQMGTKVRTGKVCREAYQGYKKRDGLKSRKRNRYRIPLHTGAGGGGSINGGKGGKKRR